jgi:hypothetical protein
MGISASAVLLPATNPRAINCTAIEFECRGSTYKIESFPATRWAQFLLPDPPGYPDCLADLILNTDFAIRAFIPYNQAYR